MLMSSPSLLPIGRASIIHILILFHFSVFKDLSCLTQFLYWKSIANYGTLNKPNRAIRLTELRKQTEECVMIKNNLEVDVKVKCLEEGITQAQLAERMEISPQYVNRVIKKNHNLLNKTFVNMMEAMGYDLQIVYVKREE